MKCSKCGADGASQRAKNYFMCRACRRAEYHKKKDIWVYVDREEKRRILRAIEWSMLAERINGEVMRGRMKT